MLIAVRRFKFEGHQYMPGDELADEVDDRLDSRLRWLLLDQRFVEQRGVPAEHGWPNQTQASAAHQMECPECHKGFTTQRGLRYHRKNMHGKE